MKVVVDTNVFIKSLYFQDTWCNRIMQEEKLRKIIFVMSEETHKELCKTIIYIGHSKGATLEDFRKPFEILTNLAFRTHRVIPKKKFDVSEHKADNKFIDCAVESESKYIITEDEHLNALGIFNPTGKKKDEVKILSPYQFMMEYNIIGLQLKHNKTNR